MDYTFFIPSTNITDIESDDSISISMSDTGTTIKYHYPTSSDIDSENLSNSGTPQKSSNTETPLTTRQKLSNNVISTVGSENSLDTRSSSISKVRSANDKIPLLMVSNGVVQELFLSIDKNQKSPVVMVIYILSIQKPRFFISIMY
jgi:hypothetical protein